MKDTDLLSGILDSMEEGVLYLNEKGELRYWNRQLLKMLHISPAKSGEQEKPKEIFETILDRLKETTDLQGLLKNVRGVKNSVSGICTLPGHHKAGWKLKRLKISTKHEGILCQFYEYGDRKTESGKKAKVLNADKEKLTKIIQGSPDSIVISDLDGQITYYNDETTRMYECEDEDQLIGSNIFELVHEEDRDLAYNNALRVIRDGVIKGVEYRIKSRRNICVHVEAAVSSLNNHHGDAVGFIVISKDVTERYNMRKILQEREKKFRSIFNHARDAIIVVDPEGYHIDSNQAALDLTGYTREETAGLHYKDLIVPENHLKSQQNVENLKAGGKGGSFENQILTRNGRRVPVNIAISPLYDNQGELTSIISVTRDISDQKNFEQQLIQAKQKAEESDRLKSAFLANMSHEIRTPMNGIMGFAEMLKRKNLSEEKKKHFISIINNSASQLLGIINDIIDISKLETGQQQITHSTFNLNHFMKEIHTLFISQAREKNLEFRLHKGLEDEKSMLTTDKTKLQQILNNLLNNAFKFTRQGKIEMGYDRQDDQLRFWVSDTGPGIPENMKEKVFGRFIQLDDMDPLANGGTGLGLSISKGLAELLGGSIHLETQPGKGATFSFHIPFMQQHHSSPTQGPEEKNSLPPETKTLSVLLVEDDPGNAIYLKELLQSVETDQIGFQVQHVTRGCEAITFSQKQEWDLVLLDLRLPDISGMEVIQAIHSKKPRLPVIAQTAYALTGDEERIKEAGFADYLAKPISPDIFQRKLFEVLKDHSSNISPA